MTGGHHLLNDCIRQERGALLFQAPDHERIRQSTKVQIIDVFSLQVATGYTRDPNGRLLLEAQPSLASGRNWTLAKAAQLIRNDARPHRWVALQLDRRAWGLFWAGGGLQRCRDLLVDQGTAADTSSALVPATPEALLRLVLDLNLPDASEELAPAPRASRGGRARQSAPGGSGRSSLSNLLSNRLESRHRHRLIWRVAIFTSMVWMGVLGATVWSFNAVMDRQDRKLELLLQRTAPAMPAVPTMPAP